MHRLLSTGLIVGVVGWQVVGLRDAVAQPTDRQPSSETSPPQAEAPSAASPLQDGKSPSPPAGAGEKCLRTVRYSATLGVISLPRVLSLDVVVRVRRSDDPTWDLFALGAGIEYLPPG